LIALPDATRLRSEEVNHDRVWCVPCGGDPHAADAVQENLNGTQTGPREGQLDGRGRGKLRRIAGIELGRLLNPVEDPDGVRGIDPAR
jgi:hypothetical protein